MAIRSICALAVAAALALTGEAAAQPMFTQPLQCPTGVRAGGAPNYVPVGWQATVSSILKLREAIVQDDFQGQQLLVCVYNTTGKPDELVITLRKAAPIRSCMLGADKRSFMCRPGSVP